MKREKTMAFMGEFDFCMVFEVVSLIFLLISKSFMGKYDENKEK